MKCTEVGMNVCEAKPMTKDKLEKLKNTVKRETNLIGGGMSSIPS